MKRVIKYTMFSLVMMIIGLINVNAAKMRSDLTEVNVGATFSVTINNPNTDSDYKIVFDEKYIKISSENTCGSDRNVLVSTMPCVIKFEVDKKLQLTDNVTTEIKLIDNGETDTTEPLRIVINKNVNKPSSTPSSDTTTTKKEETTTAKKSDNTKLSSLKVFVADASKTEFKLTPEFNKDVFEYTVEVESTVKMVSIEATPEDSNARIVLSNNAMEELKAGENNKIIITVTSEALTTGIYTINVKRESLNTDATIKELTILEASDFTFFPGIYEYDISLTKIPEKLNINVVLNDTETASYEISGNEDLEDGSVIKILVTAPDGTKKEYKLNVLLKKVTTTQMIATTQSTKNPIVILLLSIVGFTLAGSIIYVIKKK